ncbi:DUF2141 domain-containing protein [Parvularcula sp. LCG005]|uniref:DUF2141 domain-containing protein n=1 Tax=Parvularcula sp. LCG005 TaxID=3078805 RepID=UPI002941E215|nr:DUF2141 domain-containing protein [Parvularcula sp. LCG005]WOI52268.1 DUF2141 domain-containing protein [Parvularcula sp. LCG005]
MNKYLGTAAAAALLLGAAACSDDSTQTTAQNDAYDATETAQNSPVSADEMAVEDDQYGDTAATSPTMGQSRMATNETARTGAAFDQSENAANRQRAGMDTASLSDDMQQDVASVTLNVSGVEEDGGMLVATLEPQSGAEDMYNQNSATMSNDDMATPYTVEAQADGDEVELKLDNVRPGTYLVSVFQDRDGNGEITVDDRGPTEAWGTADTGAAQSEEYEPQMITVARDGNVTNVTLKQSS